MKKTFLFFIALIIGLGASAQSIDYDAVEDNGVRVISCTSEQFRSFTDKLVLSLHMSATVKDKYNFFYINATLTSNDPISAPAHARMLIKTKNGEVINLEAVNKATKEDQIGSTKNVGGTLIKTYSISLPYKISPDEIDKIINEGVAKIRIELNGDKNYEKEWKNDKKIAPFIEKEYKLLQGAVAVDKRGSFEDDF